MYWEVVTRVDERYIAGVKQTDLACASLGELSQNLVISRLLTYMAMEKTLLVIVGCGSTMSRKAMVLWNIVSVWTVWTSVNPCVITSHRHLSEMKCWIYIVTFATISTCLLSSTWSRTIWHNQLPLMHERWSSQSQMLTWPQSRGRRWKSLTLPAQFYPCPNIAIQQTMSLEYEFKECLPSHQPQYIVRFPIAS